MRIAFLTVSKMKSRAIVPAAAPSATIVVEDGSSLDRPLSPLSSVATSLSPPVSCWSVVPLPFLFFPSPRPCFGTEAAFSRIDEADAKQTFLRLKLSVSERSVGPSKVNFICRLMNLIP